MFKDKVIKNILILQIIGLILGLIFTVFTINDGFEHIRMSWLVSQGYVPYRDFFEHHHPLLWYVYLPFTLLLPHNIMLVFYFSRVFALVFSALMLFIICKIIERYMGGKQIIPYFLALILAFIPIWWSFTVLKPEILARPLYFLGLYLFFRYAETFKTKYLVWCGVSFTIAFLFIQNIVFSIIPLIIPLFYIWDKKNPNTGKDILLASVAPLTLIGIFVALIYFSGTWKDYYELCWLFNAQLFDLLHYTDSSVFWYWIVPMILGIWAWVYQVKHKQSSFYINTIGLLFCCEMIQRLSTKAVFNHYMILIFIFISMLCAPVFAQIKKRFVLRLCYITLLASLAAGLVTLRFANNLEAMEKYRLVNSNPDDNTLVNVNFSTINIWEPKKSYYVMFLGVTLIDDFLFSRDTSYDISKYIENNKIKYIDWAYVPYTPLIFDGDDYFNRFNISQSVLDKYIRIYGDLWQRIDTLDIKTKLPEQKE